jgi:NAD(P)-dependent dehydrogenase (short-subunit alcohol dehydrogenase family)
MALHELLRPPCGLRVLVTGGGSGVGAAVARAFHAVGARVHVCDVDRSALDRLTGASPGITGSMADASVPADVDAVFEDVRSHLGGLDVLVNNAGIAGPVGPIEAMAAGEWERTVAVNLDSQYYFARRAVPHLKASPHPSLIAVGSVAGRLGYALRTPYAASKWGVVGLTQSLAIELGPQGVRVNAILPGAVEGERINGVIAARAAALGVGVDAMRAQYRLRSSLRRMVGAEDVAALALFLCSPAARNLSAQVISVDAHLEYL